MQSGGCRPRFALCAQPPRGYLRPDEAAPGAPVGHVRDIWEGWRWARKRQWRLWRGLRHRRDLSEVVDRTDLIRPGAILAFVTVRNEAERLPYFMAHYRALGVSHFLFVDNDSDDGCSEWLAAQPDVSLWRTDASYRAARFGMDWLQYLLMRHGHGHWCVTVDADELLVYPSHDTRPLPALTAWLDDQNLPALGALMLDLYPRGPLTDSPHRPGQDPTGVLNWYDAANYTIRRKVDIWALWIQGGPRSRLFLADRPQRGPTLTKVPLVRWHWRYAYLNSTHSLLPRRLNRIYDEGGGALPSGVLLHTKFLNTIASKSIEEKTRRQHFGEPGAFDAYYDALATGPDLWCSGSSSWGGWQKLEAEGLMSRGGWG